MKVICVSLILLAAICFSACESESGGNQETASANTESAGNKEPVAAFSPVATASQDKELPRPSPANLSAADSLTNQKVESAATDLLSSYRIGGSLSVIGIQELPQQNSAIADLKFNSFEYAVTFEGELLKAQNFKLPKKSGSAIPPPSEMFPPRKVSYSKDGKAILSRYTDGRWVLKEVRWGFDKGIKGSVEIR